jgi:hypothetical protein
MIRQTQNKKRERFQQLTQNPKVKIGKVFAARRTKSGIHTNGQKTHLLAQGQSAISAQSCSVRGQRLGEVFQDPLPGR